MYRIFRKALPSIALLLAVGTFLSILGPYDTHGLGIPGVWFYWTGLMALGWAAGGVSGAALERWTLPWPGWVTYAIVSVIVSIPVTLAVLVIQSIIGATIGLQDIPLVFVLVWVISAAVSAISWLASMRTPTPEAAGVGKALIEKLPHRLRSADLLALEAEDHYLRVHTANGDALILMRLTDAIAAVETLDGAQTHRSWWVARAAVDAVSRGDGRATLTLSNAVEAPVSRTYSPKLRESGWY
jgi:hypothetical protein